MWSKIGNPARYRYESRVIKIFSSWGSLLISLCGKGT